MDTATVAEHQRLGMCAFAALEAIIVAGLGVRVGKSEVASALARYIMAAVALALGGLVALDRIPPVVSYGVLCLALVSIFVADLWHEGRAHKRRVASLAPRPAADAVPTVWVVIAAMSPLMLTPYVVLREQLAAALMVGVCGLVMATIAWYLASSPVQLAGEDLQLERMRERAWRSNRAGLTAVVTVGSIMFFISVVNADLSVVTAVQRDLLTLSLVVWAVLAVWVMAWIAWYHHQLSRSSCSASS